MQTTRTRPTQRSAARRPLWALVAAVNLALFGCKDVEDDEVAGELGNGTFRYLCVDADDPVCPSGDSAADFPGRIGTDGVFDVEFEEFGIRSDPSEFRIRPVAPAIIAQDRDLLRAISPGTVALLANRTENGRIVDFVHVHVASVDALRIERAGSALAVREAGVLERTLEVGERLSLRAIPIDEDGVTLAGSRDYEWSASDETIVELDTNSFESARIGIEAVGVGMATVRVLSGGVDARIEITVEPARDQPDAGADPDASRRDAGEDALDASEAGLSDGPRDVTSEPIGPDATDARSPTDGAPQDSGTP